MFPVFGDGNVVTQCRNNYIHHHLPKMCGFIVGQLTSIVGGIEQISPTEETESSPPSGSSIDMGQDQHLDLPSISDQSSTGPPASSDLPDGVVNSPPGPTSPASPDAAPSPAVPPSDPEPNVDAAGFWRGCNAAGCTRAIFIDFIHEMTDVSSRIQSEEASQEGECRMDRGCSCHCG